MKSLRCIIAIICVFMAVGLPPAVHAQNEIEVTANSTSIKFPLEIEFKLSARHTMNITDIRLRYTLDKISLAEVMSESFINFKPGKVVDVRWIMDMKKSGELPPGTKITYWWIITDIHGAKIQTDPIVITFDDQRFSWQSLTEEPVTIFWYSGSSSIVKELLKSAQQSIKKMTGDNGITLTRPIMVYLYASAEDLRGARPYSRGWEGGISYYNFAVVTTTLFSMNMEGSKAILNHELNHQVVRQLTYNPYVNLPLWLNEGLSVYAMGDMSVVYNSALRNAVTFKKIIPIKQLISQFSADSEIATCSYAESNSIVDYLISNYGQSKMVKLLDAFKHGYTDDEALMEVYGFDTDGLNSLWQKYLLTKF